jgi:hypothetical protein
MNISTLALDFETDYRENFRQMLHDELDEWVDELMPLFEDECQPSLMDVSEKFTATRQKFLGACFEKFIENKYPEYLNQKFCSCPKCGKQCKKRRDGSKKMRTMQGPSELKRPWFYCTSCGMGFHPLDKILEISRKEHQFDIQKKTTRTSAEVPFSIVSEIFSDLTGQDISGHFIHDTFEDVGAEALLEDVIPNRNQIEQRIDKASTGKWRPILVVASDGAHVPTRVKAKRNAKRGKGRWQEAKGFRIYLLNKKRIVHIASWHQIQGEDEFGKDLRLVASRICQDKVRIALLGDGADWLWKHMVTFFPKGRQVLDYYHCSEHIHKVAKLQYGEKSRKSLEWVESTISRLFYAEVDNVIQGLQRMKPRNDTAKEEVRKLIGYLHKNRERIHYQGDRIGGYPIGSGGIESANKFVCHTRMKRSGAWWVKETGNEMLRIRCAIYNGTYDKVFEKYKAANLSR